MGKSQNKKTVERGIRMAKDELKKSLDNHQEWFKGEGVGVASLSGVTLEGPTLSEVSLNNADLGDIWSDNSKS